MKRFIHSAVRSSLTLAALALTVSAVRAQDKHPNLDPTKKSTTKVTVGGASELDYVTRSSGITAYTENDANTNVGSPIGNPVGSEREDSFEGYTAVWFEAILTEGIEAELEVGTKRIEGNPFYPPPAPSNNSYGGINEWGSRGAEEIHLRRAAVLLNELFGEGIVVKAGIIDYSFDIRGKGEAFAFSPKNSQTIERNWNELNVPITQQETPDARFQQVQFVDQNDPVGAHGTFTTGNLVIDLILLPAIIEGGQRDADEALYAVDAIQGLKELAGIPGRVGVIIAASNVRTDGGGGADNVHGRVITIGGGTSLNVTEDIEIYGEVYLQSGKVAEDAAGGDIDAAGMAYQAGIEWHHTVGNPMPLRAGFNYFYISGDSDTSATDDQAERFSAYENVNQLLIVENHYYGFDWDSNYTGFKVMAGTAFSVMDENDLDVELLVGILNTAEDVAVGAVSEDALGTEVDIKFNWSLTDQFSLKLAIGLLQGSDVLELAMDGGVPGSNRNSTDSADLYVLGFDMSF